MANHSYSVEVQSDFLEKITRAKPVPALAEFIWNSLDADASSIDVSAEQNARSRGLFAGISLNGSTLRSDNSENERIYGTGITNHEILRGDSKVTAAGRPLILTLDRYSHENIPVASHTRKVPASLGPTMDKGEVYFDLGKSDLTPDDQQSLNAVAQSLKDNASWSVEIVGWTDTAGNSASNLVLSKKRADAVKQSLIDQGIDGSRLHTRGRGRRHIRDRCL